MTLFYDNYKEYRLSNGFLVALKRTSTQTVSARLNIYHGSLNEKPGEEGLAHFLEHCLCTGGSKNYSPEQSKKIKNQFGSINAHTGLLKIFFPVEMLAEDTELYLNYISDTIFNPTINTIQMDMERKAILRELADKLGKPTTDCAELERVAIYGKDSPFSYFLLGNPNVIQTATQQNLLAYHQRGFHPNNMNLILTGNLPGNIETIIEKNFGLFPSGEVTKFDMPRNPRIKERTIIHAAAPDLLNKSNPDESNSILRLSFFAPTFTEPEGCACMILDHIIGGSGGDSRLFNSLREQKGLAYNVGSSYAWTENRGVIHLGGSIHAKKVGEAIDTIFEEIQLLRTEFVSEEELLQSKRGFKYTFAKHYEQNSGWATLISNKLELGLVPEELISQVESMTPEQIRQVAINYLPENKQGNYVLLLRDPLKNS